LKIDCAFACFKLIKITPAWHYSAQSLFQIINCGIFKRDKNSVRLTFGLFFTSVSLSGTELKYGVLARSTRILAVRGCEWSCQINVPEMYLDVLNVWIIPAYFGLTWKMHVLCSQLIKKHICVLYIIIWYYTYIFFQKLK